MLDFFGVITIGEHHGVGVPIGALAIIPRLTCWSRSSFVALLQKCGISFGVARKKALALGFRCICASGTPRIVGKNELLSLLKHVFKKVLSK